MATNASVSVLFSDGSMTYLRNAVTLATLTEIKTDNSGALNITGDLPIGQSSQDKVAIAAFCKIQTDNASTGCFGYAAFYGTDGEVLCPIQGGGTMASGMPRLVKPVVMKTGITVKVLAQSNTDAAKRANYACYTASGKCEILSVLAVDATATELVNKEGNGIGECLTDEVIVACYATYSAQKGLADTGVTNGINALYLEDSAGQLKGLISTTMGGGDGSELPVQYVPQGYMINQNDKLFVKACLS